MSNRLMWILATVLCVLWLVPLGCGGEDTNSRPEDTTQGEGEGGEGEGGEGEGGEGEGGEGEGGEGEGGEGEGDGGEGEGDGGEGEGEGGYKKMWKCITCSGK